MRIAILDYRTGDVTIESDVPEMSLTENMEAWLDMMGYNLSNIDWMVLSGNVYTNTRNGLNRIV